MSDNFQDNIVYGNSTLAVSGDAIIVGSTDAGAKSVIFNNSGSQGHLAWQPSANRTINLPDSGGMVQLTGQVPGAIIAGTQTATSGSVVFSNSNGITFGMSNSSVVTASYTVPSTVGLISNINISAGTTSNNLNALTFSNSNGLTFGLNGSVITGSYTIPTQSAQTQSNIQAIYDGANSISTGTIIFTNANGVSFSINGQTISGSVAAQSNQTLGRYAIGNTTGQSSSSTFDARTMSFSGAGNISLGYSGNALVISGAGGGGGSVNISAGTTSNNLTNFVFSNSNSISFGLSGSTITGSIPSQSVLFSNANGVSFGTSGATSVITASIAAGLISGVNLSAGTTSNNLSNFVFSNSNGVSFGLNGSTVTASVSVQTEGWYALGNTTGQSSSTTMDARSQSISGIGIISAGLSAGVIIISATQSNQTEGFYAVGNTVGQSSSSTFDARTMSFSGVGNISLGYSNNALVISGAGGGAAISAGTNSTSTGTVVFSNSNGISFGMSANGVITASVPAIAGSDIVFSNSNNIVFGKNVSTVTASATPPTISKSYALALGSQSSSAMTLGSVSFRYIGIDQYISISRLDIPVLISLSSSATTNTAAMAITSGCVIYTLNGSTLSPIVGQTALTTYTWASGTSNFANISGFRPVSFGLATLLTPGDYWVGFQLSTNTSSIGLSTTNLGNTISIMLGSLYTVSNYADIGVATSNNSGLIRLQGMCATTISNTTMTFNETQLTMTGANGFRANYNIILRNY